MTTVASATLAATKKTTHNGNRLINDDSSHLSSARILGLSLGTTTQPHPDFSLHFCDCEMRPAASPI